jgi:hypothetical protein
MNFLPKTEKKPEIVPNPKTSYFPSFGTLKPVDDMKSRTKDGKKSVFSSIGDKMKNASNSTFSSLKDKSKSNYQEWLKYGVFFFLVVYVFIIIIGLFGLPPDTLHNLFSFLTGFLDYFRLDYTSIGKPPQSDNEVKEESGVQMNFKKK